MDVHVHIRKSIRARGKVCIFRFSYLEISSYESRNFEFLSRYFDFIKSKFRLHNSKYRLSNLVDILTF